MTGVMRFLVLGTVALCASHVNAASVFYTTAKDSPGFGTVADQTRCFESSVGAATTQVCDNTRYFDAPTDGQVGKAFLESTASTEVGALKTSARAVYSQQGDAGVIASGETIYDTQAQMRADASAGFRDSWTVTGGAAGTAGKLSLSFQVDGRNFMDRSTVAGEPQDSAVAQTRISIFETVESVTVNQNLNISAQGNSRDFIDFSGSLTDYDELVTLELDIIFGQVVHFGVFMDSSVLIGRLDERSQPISASTLFDQTATLVGIDASTTSGDTIDTLGLTSQSGAAQYTALVSARNSGSGPTSPPPVPLPASFGFLLGGIALMGWRVGRKAPRKAANAQNPA